MTGTRGFAWLFNRHRRRERPAAVAVGVVLVLALQSFDLRAELLFRGMEQVDGQQRWSPVRKYSNPADTAYPRVSASGAAVPAEEVHVFLSGEITRADVDGAAVMAGLLKSGRQKLVGNTVWFASNGGDIDAGMDLGRLLRKLGAYTLVARNDQCMSACVFAFMGGERRSVTGRLGIHRPFFPFTQDTPDRQARYRHLQKTLRDYVDEMDFPASLYEAVMVVPPESMQLLTPAELKKFYLEGISPSTEDMVDAASARRLELSMVEYLRRKARVPACAFFDAGQGRCDGKVLEAVASGGAADDPGGVQKAEAAPASRAAARATTYTQGSGTPRTAARGAPGSS